MAETILVTGAAGFIGMHVSSLLMAEGQRVVGIDNLNGYYDPNLKQSRLDCLEKTEGSFEFRKIEIADREAMADLFAEVKPDRVVHLAAQAGVRYSIENPHAYVDSNLVGFMNILEGCRHEKVKHLVYASSSSVYGLNAQMPFEVSHHTQHPISLYAATKKSNEMMAHSYSHLYDIPTSGLRFFTVYGPWGRPDMALFLFTRAILEGKPIKVFNEGKLKRDFTYVDDIVQGVVRLLDHPPSGSSDWDPMVPNPSISSAPYAIYNIGNHTPVELGHFISCIEESLGKKAEKELLPMQPGDVYATSADVRSLFEVTGFSPDTPIEEGIGRFVKWYRSYFGEGSPS